MVGVMMENALVTLVSVFLGWLLGITSTVVVERIRSRKLRKALKVMLRSELTELRYMMAFLVLSLNILLGEFDDKIRQWVKPIVLSYDGPNKAEGLKIVLEKTANTDDRIFREYARLQQTQGKGKSLKKYYMPFFESQMQNLPLLDFKLQTGLHDVHTTLSCINQSIEEYRWYFEKTFDSTLGELNPGILSYNITQCYQAIATHGRKLADRISALLEEIR